jgi:hypothetical protein
MAVEVERKRNAERGTPGIVNYLTVMQNEDEDEQEEFGM